MGDNGTIVAVILLLAIAVVLVGGWLAFPAITHFMHDQSCIAAGHTNC